MADLLVDPKLDDTGKLKAPNADIDLAIEEIKLSTLNGLSGNSIEECGLSKNHGFLVSGLLRVSGGSYQSWSRNITFR